MSDNGYNNDEGSDVESLKNLLIGKTLYWLDVSPDRKFITFQLEKSTVKIEAVGGCCSRTWFEDIWNDSAILNETVIDVCNVPMPDMGFEYKSTIGTDIDKNVNLYYAIQIRTTGGVCEIIYRNLSNGYYGGSFIVVDPPNTRAKGSK